MKPDLAIGSPIWVRGAAGDRPPGSIGAYVRNADGLWLVTANHVIAGNGSFLPTAHPTHGVYAGESRISRTIVFSHLQRYGNQADAAACLLAPTVSRSESKRTLTVREGTLVSSPKGQGRIKATGTFRVNMKSAGFSLAEAEFIDSILVEPLEPTFAPPGSSGAPVLTKDRKTIGLITGTSIEHGTRGIVVSPIDAVLAVLKLI